MHEFIYSLFFSLAIHKLIFALFAQQLNATLKCLKCSIVFLTFVCSLFTLYFSLFVRFRFLCLLLARLRAMFAIAMCPLKFRTRTRKDHASTTFIRSKMFRFVHFIHEIIVTLDSLQSIRQYNVLRATCSRVKNQHDPLPRLLGKQSF